MKNKSSSKFEYNEMQMANAFQKLMIANKGLPGLGIFNNVYKEVNCLRGRADFIAFKANRSNSIKKSSQPLSSICSSILSLMKPKSPRTLTYLLRKMQYSERSINNALVFLLQNRFIKKTKTGSYVLYNASKKFMVDIYAFELKLNNPKRAIFQAQQYKAYASHVIIVAPPSQIKNYDRFSETMKRWGIGLISFDPLTNSLSIIRKAPETSVFSMRQKIYNISRLDVSDNLCN